MSTPAERVRDFLEEWRNPYSSRDPERIYTLGVMRDGEPTNLELRASDLYALIGDNQKAVER